MIVLGVVVFLGLSLRAIARFFTDYLWFDSLGASSVWRTQLGTKVTLAVIFSGAFFLLLFLNLAIADRIAPRFATVGPDDELLLRYREFVAPRQRLVRAGLSVVFALILGAGASGQWQSWLLFRHGGSFGIKDPLHARDVGFYVFTMPFLTWLVSWLFAALIVLLLLVAVAHYLNGGIRPQNHAQRVTPQVKAHLSVLMGALALVKAADYWLESYRLTLSTRGTVQGATYTDVKAQAPAITLLILISVLCAVLFVINIWQRGWALPVVALGLWALVALIAGEAYPWFIQTFQVEPKESAREAPYIERNIMATRQAMGLDKVVDRSFDYTTKPSDAAITENADTVSNIRLLDPTVVDKTYKSLQGILNYYKFNDLDVDRYSIEGKETQVVLAARELNPASLPQSTWEAQHLIYTHGYGVALAPANAVSGGRPRFLVGGVPLQVDSSVTKDFPIDRPELYYGEEIDGAGDGYAIVDTTRKEQSGSVETKYQGPGGVSLNGFIRKAAFALRFGDLEVFTSDYLTSKSRVFFNRNVTARVHQLAPFLSFDGDPYPVLVGGRVKYVLDGYTTSDTYPYAQTADTGQIEGNPHDGDLRDISFNYIRNSVKATVDAYDGSVTLYLTDDLYGRRDPVVRAYADAFPKLFTASNKIPDELRSHFRYPEDMFRVQTTTWGRYHITNPEGFYSASDQWDVAQDPGKDINNSGADTTGAVSTSGKRIAPYYLQMKLPEASKTGFLLFRPFVPHSDDDSKRTLTSFMVGKSDPGQFGQLEMFTLTQVGADGKRERNRAVDGPLIVNDNILSETKNNTSQNLTLLNSGGSKLDFGNMLIVPIDKGLLYIRPVYVRGASDNSVPELRRVIVAMGQRIEVGDTLAKALQAMFPDADISTREGGSVSGGTDTSTGSTDSGTGTTPPGATDPSSLLTQALSLFDEADAALKAGGAASLSIYQEKTAQAEALVKQAGDALASEPSGSGSTTTAPSTTAKPTTTTSAPGA